MRQSVFIIFLCVILGACSSVHRAGTLSSSEVIGYASNRYIMDKNKEIIGYYRNGYILDANNHVTGTYRNGYVFNTNDSIIAQYSNGYIWNYSINNYK